jgi:hypothetical protein
MITLIAAITGLTVCAYLVAALMIEQETYGTLELVAGCVLIVLPWAVLTGLAAARVAQ